MADRVFLWVLLVLTHAMAGYELIVRGGSRPAVLGCLAAMALFLAGDLRRQRTS